MSGVGYDMFSEILARVEFDTRAGSAEEHGCRKVDRNQYPRYWVLKNLRSSVCAGIGYDI